MVSKRGLFGHLRFAHEKTSDEAHELMGNPVESSHEEVDEEIDEEKERIERIFELFAELKKIKKRKEDIEKNIKEEVKNDEEDEDENEIIYTLTNEKAENLLDELDNIDEKICEELEDLGIEFEREEEEEEEEEEKK